MSIRLGDKIIAGCYEVVQGDVYSKIETDELLTEKANSKDLATVAFTGEYKDLKNIPFIPSDTSDLTNNANFVIDSELRPYAKTVDVLKQLNTKQDKLTVGEGITIQDRVISNTFTSSEWGKITGTITDQADLKVNLDNKINKDLSNCEKPYVTDCYHNGSSKYCLWSDGKKEQWGKATTKNITFYTPYTGTDYVFTVAIEAGNTAITNPSDLCYQNKTNVGVVWNTELGTTIKSIEWYACGY